MRFNNPKWLERRAKSDQWMFYAVEVPSNADTLTSAELGLAVKTLHQLGVIVLSRTNVVLSRRALV